MLDVINMGSQGGIELVRQRGVQKYILSKEIKAQAEELGLGGKPGQEESK